MLNGMEFAYNMNATFGLPRKWSIFWYFPWHDEWFTMAVKVFNKIPRQDVMWNAMIFGYNHENKKNGGGGLVLLVEKQAYGIRKDWVTMTVMISEAASWNL